MMNLNWNYKNNPPGLYWVTLLVGIYALFSNLAMAQEDSIDVTVIIDDYNLTLPDKFIRVNYTYIPSNTYNPLGSNKRVISEIVVPETPFWEEFNANLNNLTDDNTEIKLPVNSYIQFQYMQGLVLNADSVDPLANTKIELSKGGKFLVRTKTNRHGIYNFLYWNSKNSINRNSDFSRSDMAIEISDEFGFKKSIQPTGFSNRTSGSITQIPKPANAVIKDKKRLVYREFGFYDSLRLFDDEIEASLQVYDLAKDVDIEYALQEVNRRYSIILPEKLLQDSACQLNYIHKGSDNNISQPVPCLTSESLYFPSPSNEGSFMSGKVSDSLNALQIWLLPTEDKGQRSVNDVDINKYTYYTKIVNGRYNFNYFNEMEDYKYKVVLTNLYAADQEIRAQFLSETQGAIVDDDGDISIGGVNFDRSSVAYEVNIRNYLKEIGQIKEKDSGNSIFNGAQTSNLNGIPDEKLTSSFIKHLKTLIDLEDVINVDKNKSLVVGGSNMQSGPEREGVKAKDVASPEGPLDSSNGERSLAVPANSAAKSPGYFLHSNDIAISRKIIESQADFFKSNNYLKYSAKSDQKKISRRARRNDTCKFSEFLNLELPMFAQSYNDAPEFVYIINKEELEMCKASSVNVDKVNLRLFINDKIYEESESLKHQEEYRNKLEFIGVGNVPFKVINPYKFKN